MIFQTPLRHGAKTGVFHIARLYTYIHSVSCVPTSARTTHLKNIIPNVYDQSPSIETPVRKSARRASRWAELAYPGSRRQHLCTLPARAGRVRSADLGPSRHARQGVDPLRSGIPELRLADTAGVCYTIPPYPAIAWSAVRVSRTAPASTTATRCIGKRRVTDARSRSPTTTLRIPPPR